MWALTASGGDQISLEEVQLTTCLSALMASRSEFIGTPTQLSEQIDPDGAGGISPKKVARQLMKNAGALRKAGITFTIRRSNGKRLIELRRAESDDPAGTPGIDPCGTGEISESTKGTMNQGVEIIAG